MIKVNLKSNYQQIAISSSLYVPYIVSFFSKTQTYPKHPNTSWGSVFEPQKTYPKHSSPQEVWLEGILGPKDLHPWLKEDKFFGTCGFSSQAGFAGAKISDCEVFFSRKGPKTHLSIGWNNSIFVQDYLSYSFNYTYNLCYSFKTSGAVTTTSLTASISASDETQHTSPGTEPLRPCPPSPSVPKLW